MTILFSAEAGSDLSANPDPRKLLVSFLNNDTRGAILRVKLLGKGRSDCHVISEEKVFPPRSLIGTAPDISQMDLSNNKGMLRRRHVSSTAATITSNIPTSVGLKIRQIPTSGCSKADH